MLPLFDRTTRLPLPLRQALDSGATIVTANVRAARALHAAYASDEIAARLDCSAWPTPPILDWASWLNTLYGHYARRTDDAPMLLTSLGERQLWQRAQGADRDRVVAPRRMADLAQQAYALLGSYRAQSLRRSAARSPFGAPHEDAERFFVWAAGFDRACEQHGWLSRTLAEDRLCTPGRLHRLPAKITLVGFDRITPAQAALLAAVEQAGTRIQSYNPEPSVASPSLYTAPTARAELEACAHWCQALLTADAGQRIAVIAPDPSGCRAELDRVFRRVLTPQSLLWHAPNPQGPAGSADAPPPYEFSLGSPLAEVPALAAALLLLRWLHAPLPAGELTWLLTSGFLAASPADARALARLDAELRRAPDSSPQVALGSLLARPRTHNLPASTRTLLERFAARAGREGILAAAASSPRRQGYARWAELTPALLAEAGWPGQQPLDSFAFQAQGRWSRLLAELAELDFEEHAPASQPTWASFLATLEAEAHATIFAPESTSAPVQILGAYESSGQSFDALWFLGAGDADWPSIGRPHPLLPAWLQREAGMPHATPDADWLLAKEATGRILSSAPTVVLSYTRERDGSPQRPSPLLPAHTTPFVPMQPPAHTAAGGLQPTSLETVVDDSGLLPWTGEQSAGGAEVLKRQAACAFQSFAGRRLQARALEQPEQGMDAAERGILLHEVLERLWSGEAGKSGQSGESGGFGEFGEFGNSGESGGFGESGEYTAARRLHTRDDLRRALADNSAAGLVDHHIAAALAARLPRDGMDAWQKAYHRCEQDRLRDRILAWLLCEQERQPFTVEALEKEFDNIALGTLRLNLRPDRIDRLSDGTRLLLDYKTGKVAASAWEGERPEEPQLPLYALFGSVEQVSGVAFGQIRADGTKLLVRAEDAAGQVSERCGPPTSKTHYDDGVRDSWRAALLALAGQFTAGDARVNPRNGGATCRFCRLAGLCRVHSLPAIDLDDEAADDA